jgi:bifunctional non-homologous end joining protein LigD
VGTGFTDESLNDLHERFQDIASDKPPFANPPRGSQAANVHWLKPKLVAEVAFGSWTSDGILRHAVFHGLREDKKPSSVSRERPVAAPSSAPRKPRSAPKPQSKSRNAPDVRLTNPDRVLYPELGLTKRDLADFYTKIADWILPHLAERPLAIVRCPEGREGACFFQRHVGQGMPQGIYGIEVEEKEGPEQNLAIKDLSGLLGLVQIGALEIHPWGSREKRLDRPDRLIFDLDPGDGVTWPELIAAARELKQRLEALDLTSFVRTTGGKGIHLVLPIRPTLDWPALKAFARGFASALERDNPDRYISKMSKARRAGKIYVDYLRNEQGSTAIASYSTRARPGAPVATPITWSELGPRLDPGAFTVATIPRRLSRRSRDPWEGFFTQHQALRREVIDQFPD